MAKPDIRLRYSSFDGYEETETFTSLAAARAYAHDWIGAHPEIGRTYAISGDGIGKIEAVGVHLNELFPPAT